MSFSAQVEHWGCFGLRDHTINEYQIKPNFQVRLDVDLGIEFTTEVIYYKIPNFAGLTNFKMNIVKPISFSSVTIFDFLFIIS